MKIPVGFGYSIILLNRHWYDLVLGALFGSWGFYIIQSKPEIPHGTIYFTLLVLSYYSRVLYNSILVRDSDMVKSGINAQSGKPFVIYKYERKLHPLWALPLGDDECCVSNTIYYGLCSSRSDMSGASTIYRFMESNLCTPFESNSLEFVERIVS